jgi:hypothetical protein
MVTVKTRLLEQLERRFPVCRKLPASQSLFDLGAGRRIYVRYSKLHPGSRAFYGLRQNDLTQLDGFQSLLCFLWDAQVEPLLIPYRDFEEVFRNTQPAHDGQFKVQVYVSVTGTELYIARAGRFNVEGYLGWNETNNFASAASDRWNQKLKHNQVQTLIAAVGVSKGHAVWLPRGDRTRLDWSLTPKFEINNYLSLDPALDTYAREIDVIWTKLGGSEINALFEIEHSTAIYSGLLRFNDVRLLSPKLEPRFTIVANDARRARFTAQLNRPTFRASGLADRCSFLDYANVVEWHRHFFGEFTR